MSASVVCPTPWLSMIVDLQLAADVGDSLMAMYMTWLLNPHMLCIFMLSVLCQRLPTYIRSSNPYCMISSSGVRPIESLTISNAGKRGVSYSFTASPTSGASYEVTFTHQRSGIPQAGTDRAARAGFRNKAGLIPDVTYRLQVVAVLSGVRSTAVSKDFTTQPDGETAMTTVYEISCVRV